MTRSLRRRRTPWEWQADRWRDQRLARRTANIHIAPPTRAWGSLGRATIVPPLRVLHPECISIGDDVTIAEHAMFVVVPSFDDIVPRLVIEDGVRIGRCCAFGVVGEVTVGRNARIGDFAMIVDAVHPFGTEARLAAVDRPRPVRIGEGAELGTHVVVLPGVTVGAGAQVEHHSVVGQDVPAGEWVAGYPARRRPAARRH